MPQSITITYGTLIIGGSGNLKIRKYTQRKRRGEFSFSCEFMVSDPSIAGFAAKTITAETDGSTPDKRLKIEIGATTVLDVGEDDFTAFDVTPDIAKTGDRADTVRTRIYTLSITARLDPSKAGFDGRFESEIQTIYLENRARRVFFRGSYHAQAAPVSENALERYLAKGKLFAQAFLDNLDTPPKKWQIKQEDITQNEGIDGDPTAQKPSIVRFVLQYDELVASQTQVPDTLDPRITSQNITVSRSTPGIEDSVVGGIRARKFEDFAISYSCVVNKEITTDLRSFYDSDIRGLALRKIQNRFPEFPGSLQIEDVTFDDIANSITVQFRFSTANAGQYTEIRFEQRLRTDEGLLITPLLTGDLFLADIQQGPKIMILQQTLAQTVLLPGSPLPMPKPPNGFVQIGEPDESIFVFETGRLSNRRTLAQIRQTIEYRRVNQYTSRSRFSFGRSITGSGQVQNFTDLQNLAIAGGASQGANVPRVNP